MPFSGTKTIPKKEDKPLYRKVWPYITGAAMFLAAALAILWYGIDLKQQFFPSKTVPAPTFEEEVLPLMDKNILHITLKKICEDIDSRPLAQQAVTEKQYLGLRIKRERLKVLEVEINPGDESIYNLVLTFPDQPTIPNSKWIILGTVSKDLYPQLRIAREGMEFYLSGEIEYTFRRDRVPYIDLSNITLEFE